MLGTMIAYIYGMKTKSYKEVFIMAENIVTTQCQCGAGLECTFEHSTYNTLCITVEPCEYCAVKYVEKKSAEIALREIFEKHYFNHPSNKKDDLDY